MFHRRFQHDVDVIARKVSHYQVEDSIVPKTRCCCVKGIDSYRIGVARPKRAVSVP